MLQLGARGLIGKASSTTGRASGFGQWQCPLSERRKTRVRTSNVIVPDPVMLIGSNRSFPCVRPNRGPFRAVTPNLAIELIDSFIELAQLTDQTSGR